MTRSMIAPSFFFSFVSTLLSLWNLYQVCVSYIFFFSIKFMIRSTPIPIPNARGSSLLVILDRAQTMRCDGMKNTLEMESSERRRRGTPDFTVKMKKKRKGKKKSMVIFIQLFHTYLDRLRHNPQAFSTHPRKTDENTNYTNEHSATEGYSILFIFSLDTKHNFTD